MFWHLRIIQKALLGKFTKRILEKKELELGVVKRNNYPKITVYGRYYLYGSNLNSYPRALGNIEPSNFSVGASLNMPLFDGMKNRANIQKTALELKQLHVERDKAIAQLMTRLASMRTNLIYLDEQITENNEAISELTDKEKSVRKLVSKRVASPIEGNEAKIDLLNQQIELDKNSINKIAITKGIEILTEEY